MLFKKILIKASAMTNHPKLNFFSGLASVQMLSRMFKLASTGVIAGMLASFALAAELQDISFSSIPGGKFQIRMDFDQTPPEPAAYNIERPARIALDLPGVSSALEQKKFALSYGNAQSVVVLETQDRTRVVINLVELSPYITKVEGNSLLIEVGNSEVVDPYKAADPAIGQDVAVNDSKAGITHIDFQRGEAGEGNVVIELSDDQVDVDVRFEGQKILIEFSDASVPGQLQRRYDVTDFATPVTDFEVSQTGADTSITIAPSGEYDYLAYQTDNVYVLSVRPLTNQEIEEQKRAFAFVGEKLSLNFQDIKVRSVLQLIADFTELNLVTSDSVGGSITLRLQDVPWDQALELILKTKGLDKRQVGNVLMVAPAAEIAERERQEIETQKQLQELAPLQTEFIRIRYASARELFKLFDAESDENGEADSGAGATGSILSPRGRVVVDERTNALLITDTAEKIEEFRRLIANIDVPLRQVLVEARIVVATDNFDQQIGVQWGGGAAEQGNGSRFGVTGSLDSLLNEVGADDDELTSVFDFVNGNGSLQFPDANVVDLGISDTVGQAQSLAIGYLSDNFALNAELSAIAAEGRGEVVSQPKVITGDKQEAEIKTGEEIPYVESSSSGRSTIKFREAVLSLKVTPSITPDNRLILDLVIKQDSRSEDFVFGENNSQVPIILKNEIRTQALVDNGKTIVLGGVFRESELEQETKVPLLGDIPILGRLFKRTIVGSEKNELLIFITPRILTDRVLD